MKEIINIVSTNTFLGFFLIAVALIVLLVGFVAYIVAFIQGREISFWPPKIGAKPFQKTTEDTGAELTDAVRKQRTNLNPELKEAGEFYQKNSRDIWQDRNQNFIKRPPLATVQLKTRAIAVLETVDGPSKQSIHILETGHRDITVGSDISCDLPIESNLLTRQHFRIRITLKDRKNQLERGYRFEVIDSGSTNGTFVNGKLINQPTIIGSGAIIEAGDTTFRFYLLGNNEIKSV